MYSEALFEIESTSEVREHDSKTVMRPNILASNISIERLELSLTIDHMQIRGVVSLL